MYITPEAFVTVMARILKAETRPGGYSVHLLENSDFTDLAQARAKFRVAGTDLFGQYVERGALWLWTARDEIRVGWVGTNIVRDLAQEVCQAAHDVGLKAEKSQAW